MAAQSILGLSKKCGIAAALLVPTFFAMRDASALTQCDATATDCATGSADMKFESAKSLATLIETPWFPDSGPVQVKALVSIDPVKGDSLYSIDMPKGAVLEASWPEKGFLTLRAAGGETTDGTLKIHHTLTPEVQVHAHIASFDQVFTFSAASLLAKIPGSNFNYDAQGHTYFVPWGFSGSTAQVKGPDLNDSLLFSMGFDTLPEIVSDNLAGDFGISATTTTSFAYKTTKVSLSGADGTLADANGSAKVPVVDGDFQELYAQVEGTITVNGELDLVPNAHVTRIGTFNVDTTLSYAVVKTNFTAGDEKVIFQSQLVHIPLPNVHMPDKAIDLGSAKVGASVDGKATIQNSGEQGAKFTAQSSDPQFVVDNADVLLAAKGSSDLKITFKPASDGPQTATITITSTDPDSPVQTFKVTANGGASNDGTAKNGADNTDDGSPTGNAGGCGCKTAGAASGTGGSLGGLAGLAMMLGLVIRRRRNRK